MAIWIPLIWFLIAGSRYVSRWFDLGAPANSADVYLEGSPVDRTVFLLLIIAGAMILMKRRLIWKELFTKNRWMVFFFLFGAISFFWSEYPMVSLKRWVKALGNVIMVLVILTEQRPFEAVGVIFRRMAFVLLPLSVLFIKYYPKLGRAYHMGSPMFTGVADQKNGLGQICLVSGIYFSWFLILKYRDKNGAGLSHYYISLMILPIIGWLLYMTNSATSLSCMVIALGFFLVGRLPVVSRDPRRILTLGFAFIGIFGILELSFSISESIIVMLGRTPDLTTRVPMWLDLIAMVKNPIIGFGYESFWSGARILHMMDRWGFSGSGQAHNGYLQVYLDIGLVGLFILVGWILSSVRKVMHYLEIDYPQAMLRLCFIIVVALYSWSEATFHGVSLMWSVFLIGYLDAPGRHQSIY